MIQEELKGHHYGPSTHKYGPSVTSSKHHGKYPSYYSQYSQGYVPKYGSYYPVKRILLDIRRLLSQLRVSRRRYQILTQQLHRLEHLVRIHSGYVKRYLSVKREIHRVREEIRIVHVRFVKLRQRLIYLKSLYPQYRSVRRQLLHLIHRSRSLAHQENRLHKYVAKYHHTKHELRRARHLRHRYRLEYERLRHRTQLLKEKINRHHHAQAYYPKTGSHGKGHGHEYYDHGKAHDHVYGQYPHGGKHSAGYYPPNSGYYVYLKKLQHLLLVLLRKMHGAHQRYEVMTQRVHKLEHLLKVYQGYVRRYLSVKRELRHVRHQLRVTKARYLKLKRLMHELKYLRPRYHKVVRQLQHLKHRLLKLRHLSSRLRRYVAKYHILKSRLRRVRRLRIVYRRKIHHLKDRLRMIQEELKGHHYGPSTHRYGGSRFENYRKYGRRVLVTYGSYSMPMSHVYYGVWRKGVGFTHYFRGRNLRLLHSRQRTFEKLSDDRLLLLRRRICSWTHIEEIGRVFKGLNFHKRYAGYPTKVHWSSYLSEHRKFLHIFMEFRSVIMKLKAYVNLYVVLKRRLCKLGLHFSKDIHHQKHSSSKYQAYLKYKIYFRRLLNRLQHVHRSIHKHFSQMFGLKSRMHLFHSYKKGSSSYYRNERHCTFNNYGFYKSQYQSLLLKMKTARKYDQSHWRYGPKVYRQYNLNGHHYSRTPTYGQVRCHRKLIFTMRRKCCCKSHHSQRRFCRRNRWIDIKATSYQSHNKCVSHLLTTSVPVGCKIGVLRRIIGRQHSDGSLLIRIIRGSKRKCRCVKTHRIKHSRWRCPKTTWRTVCRHQRKQLVKFATFYVLIGGRCDQRHNKIIRNIRCSHYTTLIKRVCDPVTGKSYYIFKKVVRRGCACVTLVYKRRHGVCKCPAPRTSTWRCNRLHNHLERLIVFYDLVNNRCHRRVSKQIRAPLSCSIRVWHTRRCDPHSGIEKVYQHKRCLIHCKCRVRSHFYKLQRCGCNHLNRGISYGHYHVKKYCDRIHNQWVFKKWRYYFLSDTRRCVKRINTTYHPIHYHQGIIKKRQKCNMYTKKRRIIIISYYVHDCKVHRRVHAKFVHCGCSGRITRRFCDQHHGDIVHVIIVKRWNTHLDRCVTLKRVIRRHIKCYGTKVLLSHCNGHYYIATRISYQRLPHLCKCQRSIHKTKHSCRCRLYKRITSCIGNHRYLIITVRHWNHHSRRCEIARRVRYPQQCRCPPKKVRKVCKNGQVIKRTTHYILTHGVCRRIYRAASRAIRCYHNSVRHVGPCHHCQSVHSTLIAVPHPTRCTCTRRPVRQHRCRCCPCPHPSAPKRYCAGHAVKISQVFWRPVVGPYGCVTHCRRQVRLSVKTVHCPPAPPSAWTKCHYCRQKQVVFTRVLSRDCHCRLHRRVVGTRACCCRSSPYARRFCSRGHIVTIHKKYTLSNYRCYVTVTRDTRPKICPRDPLRISYGHCNRLTCRQCVYGYKFVLNRTACKCILKRYLLRKRVCCCKEKSYVKKVCDGACLTIRRFSYRLCRTGQQCQKKEAISSYCVRKFHCPHHRVQIGACHTVSGYRYIYTHVWRPLNCKCRRFTTRRVERCRCPHPTAWHRKCTAGGVVVYYRRYFHLRHGRCVSVRQTRHRYIRCHDGVLLHQHIGRCNRVTCRRRIVKVYGHRQSCTCIQKHRQHIIRCCCPPPTSRIICSKNHHVVRISRAYQRIDDSCVPKTVKEVLYTVHSCPSIVNYSHCNHSIGKRIVYRFLQRVVHCKCRKYRKITSSIPCGCRRPIVHRGHCNTRACIQVIHIHSYVYVHGKCITRRRSHKIPCCCLPPRVRRLHRCNPVTGNFESIIRTRKFNHRARRCLASVRVRETRVGCLRRRSHIIRGHCNYHTGIAIDKCKVYKRKAGTCGCEAHVRLIRRICSCKHHRSYVHSSCQYGFKVRTHVQYVLRHGQCLRDIHVQRHRVICSRKVTYRRVCKYHAIHGQLLKTKIHLVGCRCTPYTTSRPIICRVPPPRRIVKCYNPVIVYTWIKFIVNHRQTQLRRIIRQRSVLPKCHRHNTRHVGRCNHINCTRFITTYKYGIKHCRCVIVRKYHRPIKCCCPKSYRRLKCNHHTGVVTCYKKRFVLRHGTCLLRMKVSNVKTICPHERIIRHSCHGYRNQGHIIIVRYKRYGCSCRKYKKIVPRFCHCPAPHTYKEHCNQHMNYQRIYRVYYKIAKYAHYHKCVRVKHLLYREPCRCPPPSHHIRCEGSKWIKIRVSYRFHLSGGRRQCVSSVSRHSRIVRCRKSEWRRSHCTGNVKTIYHIFYRLYNCRCRRFIRRRYQACNCHSKNLTRRFCKYGVIVTVKRRWIAVRGHAKCILMSTSAKTPLACPRKKHIIPLTRSCPIMRHCGYYRRYKVVWHVLYGCRCVRRLRYITRLCHCRRSYTRSHCHGSVMVKKSYTFRKYKGRCALTITVRRKVVRCSLPPVQVHRTACGLHHYSYGHHKHHYRHHKTCFRIYHVKLHFVRNCRCRRRKLTFHQICCAPRSYVKHFCDARNGYRVRVVRHFFLQNKGVLFDRGSAVILRNVVRSRVIVTRKAVVCPSGSIFSHCNIHAGKQTMVRVFVRRHRCHCHRKRLVYYGVCKCPAPRRHVGKCIGSYRTITVTVFYARAYNKYCKRSVHHYRQICACPRGGVRRYCDTRYGNWVTCHTRYTLDLHRHACKRTKRCFSKAVSCPVGARIRRGHCDHHTGKQEVVKSWQVLSRHSCRCVQRHRSYFVSCLCSHHEKRSVRCVSGFVKTVTVKRHLHHGICLASVHVHNREIVCDGKHVRYLNDCNHHPGTKSSGYRTKLITWYEKKHCHCHLRKARILVPCVCRLIPRYRPRVSRTCTRNVINTFKHVWHVMGERCVRTVWRTSKPIVCIHPLRVRRTKCYRIRSGAYVKKIFVYRWIPAHCRCVWKRIRTYIRVCKCPRPRVKVTCQVPDTIIKLRVLYYPTVPATTCVRHYRSSSHAVTCPHSQSHVGACDTHSCNQKVVRIFYTIAHCRCHRHRRFYHRKCCCPHPTPPHRSCSPDGTQIITRWRKYTLYRGRCYTLVRTRSYYLRCNRRPPHISVGPCKGHFRVRKVVTYRAVHCHCKSQVHVSHVRCSCPAWVHLHRGVCHRYWAIDTWTALRFKVVYGKRKCVRVVLRRRRRRCRCPPNRVNRRCVSEDRIVTHRVSFYLSKKKNCCVKTVSRMVRRLDNCHRRPVLIRILHGKCSKVNRYVQTDRYIYTVARGCRCRHFVRVRRWTCNCRRAYPILRRVRCVGHSELIFIKKLKVNHGNKCVWRCHQHSRHMWCTGHRRIRRACNKLTGRRRIDTFKRVAVNCRCHWRHVRSIHEACWCKHPYRTRKCIRHRVWALRCISHRLERGRCWRRVREIYRQVRCREGTQVKWFKCNKVTGSQVVIRIHRRLRNCHCAIRKMRSVCRCRCRRGHQKVICRRHSGIIEWRAVAYRLNHCRCEEKRFVRRRRVVCRRYKPYCRVGPCIAKGPYGDGYRTIRKTTVRRIGCKCHHGLKSYRRLCRCSPHARVISKCHNHNVFRTIVSKRIKKYRRCVRVFNVVRSKKVCCPKRRIYRVCNKHTGLEVVSVVTYHLIHCKCKKHVRVHTKKCGCDPTKRLIHVSACIHCRQYKVYEVLRLRYHRCVVRRYKKACICCCPRHVKVRHRCLSYLGVIETRMTTYKLTYGRCMPVTKVSRRHVHCDYRKRRHVIRNAYGALIIKVINYRRVGCKCRRRVRVFHKRWRCRYPKSYLHCHHHKIVNHLVSYHPSHGHCIRSSTALKIPISCGKRKYTVSLCHPVKFGSAKTIRSVTYRRKGCRCVAVVHVHWRVCSCRSSHSKRVCNHHTGEILDIHYKYRPTVSGRACRRVRVVHRHPVHCRPSHWIPVSHSHCHVVYKRRVRRGCLCRWQRRHATRRRKCPGTHVHRGYCNKHTCTQPVKTTSYHLDHHCRCIPEVRVHREKCCGHYYPKRCRPSHLLHRRCLYGVVVVEVFAYWKRVGYHCQRKIRRVRRRIHCAKRRIVKVGHCVYNRQKFVEIYGILHNCHCSIRRKFVHRHCGYKPGWKRPTDVVFLVDEGAATRHVGFHNKIEYFFSKTFASLPHTHHVKMGVISFGKHPKLLHTLSDHWYQWKKLGFGHTSKEASLRSALKLTRHVFGHTSAGTKKVAILLTDGRVDDKSGALSEAERLYHDGVKINVIGLHASHSGRSLLKKIVYGHHHHGRFINVYNPSKLRVIRKFLG